MKTKTWVTLGLVFFIGIAIWTSCTNQDDDDDFDPEKYGIDDDDDQSDDDDATDDDDEVNNQAFDICAEYFGNCLVTENPDTIDFWCGSFEGHALDACIGDVANQYFDCVNQTNMCSDQAIGEAGQCKDQMTTALTACN